MDCVLHNNSGRFATKKKRMETIENKEFSLSYN